MNEPNPVQADVTLRSSAPSRGVATSPEGWMTLASVSSVLTTPGKSTVIGTESPSSTRSVSMNSSTAALEACRENGTEHERNVSRTRAEKRSDEGIWEGGGNLRVEGGRSLKLHGRRLGCLRHLRIIASGTGKERNGDKKRCGRRSGSASASAGVHTGVRPERLVSSITGQRSTEV